MVVMLRMSTLLILETLAVVDAPVSLEDMMALLRRGVAAYMVVMHRVSTSRISSKSAVVSMPVSLEDMMAPSQRGVAAHTVVMQRMSTLRILKTSAVVALPVSLEDNDGTAAAWGYNPYGGAGVDVTNIVDISCGVHACVARYLPIDSSQHAK